MRGKKTRVLAILVVLVMMFALMPAQAVFAEYKTDGTCPLCGRTTLIVDYSDTEEHEVYCGWLIDESDFCSFGPIFEDHYGGAATCSAKAVCEGCRSEYGDLDLSKHTGTSTITGKKAATCTEAGYTGDTVWECCNTKVEGETIAALGHSWGEWKVTKEATTTEEGVETRVCKNDSSHTETRKIAKKEETKDEETKANSESKTKKTSTATTDAQPQTGDESQNTWIIMMMLSATLLIALIRRRTHQGTN